MEQRTGLVHIYCGDGKGKTTASLGLAIRAAGRGMKVVIVQFLKGGQTGELSILRQLPNVQIIRCKERLGFTFRMDEQQKKHAAGIQQELFASAKACVGHCDLLILDEIMAAINTGMVKVEQVQELVASRPPELEVVLTGRNPPDELLELADYVSEIHKVRHPFDRGVPARDGIER